METIVLDKCPRVETERLVLRKWETNDLAGLTELCGDPEVMKFFSGVQTPEETEMMLGRMLAEQDKYGFCFPAVEDKQSGRLLGFSGFKFQETGFPFEPCVHIGWRLQRDAWGKGIATEAARFWLSFGFKTLNLDEIISVAVFGNHRSENTMKKLGMVYCEGADFLEVGMAANNPLAHHFKYRITKQQFIERNNGTDTY